MRLMYMQIIIQILLMILLVITAVIDIRKREIPFVLIGLGAILAIISLVYGFARGMVGAEAALAPMRWPCAWSGADCSRTSYFFIYKQHFFHRSTGT